MERYWIVILIFFAFGLISVGIVSAADDGVKEYCAIDVTTTPDAKAFANEMKTISGWINRGVGHVLEGDESFQPHSGVIWDVNKAEPNVVETDLLNAGFENQADILYFAGYGYIEEPIVDVWLWDWRLTYEGGNPEIASYQTFGVWNDDLDWAVLATDSVLKVDFDSNGWPSGPGTNWSEKLRGSNNPAHGLFGYHAGAPGAGVDDVIAKDFVEKLKSGNTFIDAWKSQAGYQTNWAIIINIKNKNDHLPGCGDVTSDSTLGRLYYYDASNPNGKPITVAKAASWWGNKESFVVGVDSVYLRGILLPPGQSIRIYIIDDTTLSDGVDIPSDVRNSYQLYTVPISYNWFHQMIWHASKTKIGQYDIVVDINANGKYDEGIDIIDSIETVGFEVIPEFPTIVIPVITILGLVFLTSRRRQKR